MAQSRAQLVRKARGIYIAQGGHAGLSRAEASRRFDMLISGNSNTYLERYIRRHGGRTTGTVGGSGG